MHLVLTNRLLDGRAHLRPQCRDDRVGDLGVAELRIVARAVYQRGRGAMLEGEFPFQPTPWLGAIHQLEHQRMHARSDGGDMVCAEAVGVAELDDRVLDWVRHDAVGIGLEAIVRELPARAEALRELRLVMARRGQHAPESAPSTDQVLRPGETLLRQHGGLQAVARGLGRVQGLGVAAEHLADASGLGARRAECVG